MGKRIQQLLEKVYVQLKDTDFIAIDTQNENQSYKISVGNFLSNCVKKTGDSISGFLNLNYTPTANNHAVNKNYVDTLNTQTKVELIFIKDEALAAKIDSENFATSSANSAEESEYWANMSQTSAENSANSATQSEESAKRAEEAARSVELPIDDTLTKAGYAADAKAVGDRIGEVPQGSVTIDLEDYTAGTPNNINADTLGGQLPEYYATANTVKQVQSTADAAMPKTGGTFIGTVKAESVNNTGIIVRNIVVVDNAGSQVSTNYIRMARK